MNKYPFSFTFSILLESELARDSLSFFIGPKNYSLFTRGNHVWGDNGPEDPVFVYRSISEEWKEIYKKKMMHDVLLINTSIQKYFLSPVSFCEFTGPEIVEFTEKIENSLNKSKSFFGDKITINDIMYCANFNGDISDYEYTGLSRLSYLCNYFTKFNENKHAVKSEILSGLNDTLKRSCKPEEYIYDEYKNSFYDFARYCRYLLIKKRNLLTKKEHKNLFLQSIKILLEYDFGERYVSLAYTNGNLSCVLSFIDIFCQYFNNEMDHEVKEGVQSVVSKLQNDIDPEAYERLKLEHPNIFIVSDKNFVKYFIEKVKQEIDKPFNSSLRESFEDIESSYGYKNDHKEYYDLDENSFITSVCVFVRHHKVSQKDGVEIMTSVFEKLISDAPHVEKEVGSFQYKESYYALTPIVKYRLREFFKKTMSLYTKGSHLESEPDILLIKRFFIDLDITFSKYDGDALQLDFDTMLFLRDIGFMEKTDLISNLLNKEI